MPRGPGDARQRALVSHGAPRRDVGRGERVGDRTVVPLVLRAHSLWKSYTAGVAGCSARIWVLRAASLEVHAGECIAILGARGAGTTTLLQCLAGLRRVDAGTIEHRQRPRLFASRASSGPHAAPHADDIVLVDDATAPEVVIPLHRAVCEPAEHKVTTIIATHELSRVRHLVDRALLLRDGHLTPLPLRSGSRRVAEHSASAATSVSKVSRRRPITVNRSP
jgi:ABC-type polar amino acid transport system ATPase subunit